MKGDVPFILIGGTEFRETPSRYDYSNGFRGVLINGMDASIETIYYMPKHEFIAKVLNRYIIYCLVWMKKVYY